MTEQEHFAIVPSFKQQHSEEQQQSSENQSWKCGSKATSHASSLEIQPEWPRHHHQCVQKLSLSWRDQCCHFPLSEGWSEAEAKSWQTPLRHRDFIIAISSGKNKDKPHHATGELAPAPPTKASPPLLGTVQQGLGSRAQTGLGITMCLVPFCGTCRTRKYQAKTQVLLKIQVIKKIISF